MAHRVIAAAALLAAVAAASGAEEILSRSGMTRAMSGQWAEAVDRLAASGSKGPAEQYFRAVSLLGLGLRTEALEDLRTLSDEGGAFSGPALERAVEEFFGNEEHLKVLEWASTSLAERFQEPDTLNYRVGQSHFLLQQYREAIPRLETVASTAYRPYALHSLALIHFATGAHRVALERIEEALAASRAHPDATVAAALEDYLQLTRGRVLFEVARVAEVSEEGRVKLFELAKEVFEGIGPESAVYAEALRGAGWCALETGDAARALAAFEAAWAAGPSERHEDRWAQGRVYQRLGYYGEAVKTFKEAQAEALAAADALVEGGTDPGTNRRVSEWRRVVAEVARARARLRKAAEPTVSVARAGDALEARLADALGQLEGLEARGKALESELQQKSVALKDYLDVIPASGLFPRSARPRLASVADQQDWLKNELARLEHGLSRLAASRAWQEGGDAARQRTEETWARLVAARDKLADAQLAFLEAVKSRVSAREEELADTIRSLTERARELGRPVEEGRRKIQQARLDLEEVRGRLDGLSRRADETAVRLDRLGEGARRERSDALRNLAAARAEELRLRADRYALDETQALHLMGEEAGAEP